jgi:superfamily II DNA or RNA helicase
MSLVRAVTSKEKSRISELPKQALLEQARDWQREALKEWQENGNRGIAEVVTGGGKTFFALLCMASICDEREEMCVAVVVPSLALADQWFVEIVETLGVDEDRVFQRSGNQPIPDQAEIVISVLNTARAHGLGFEDEAKVLLIVDECHRAGAPSSQQALEGEFVASLGLSATPERNDDGLADALIPKLGPIIYRYGYPEASKDGVITPFELKNVAVPLTAREGRKYENLTKKIAKAYQGFKAGNLDEDVLKALLRKRASLAARAKYRVPVAIALIEKARGRRAVIFHESIDAAEEITRELKLRGHSVAIYHSGIGLSLRRDNLRQFRSGRIDVLVSCRALDEGMNVPEAEIGIIASSTSSTRQRIQRLGRVLRPAEGKERAEVITLYATEVEERRLRSEEIDLIETASVSWERAILASSN